jgi:intracellular sulfur oxidation DsrE/DsrF family protein
MGNFLKTLPELGKELWRVVMVNAAVKLSAASNPNLEALRALEARGVGILVCGTCLEFFGLLDKRAVGQTTNMLDVVTSLQLASKVINI